MGARRLERTRYPPGDIGRAERRQVLQKTRVCGSEPRNLATAGARVPSADVRARLAQLGPKPAIATQYGTVYSTEDEVTVI